MTLALLLGVLLGTAGGFSLRAQAPAEAAGEVAATQPEAVETAPSGFLEIVFAGGISSLLILIVLLGLSLTAAYLVFEQLMTLRRSEIMPDGLDDDVHDLIKAGQFRQAHELCGENRSFLSLIIRQGLVEVDGDWHDVEKAMEDATAEQSAQLFRRIEYLSVIGNIAPMLGLLGTVVGMIMAFQQVATTQGSAGAGELADLFRHLRRPSLQPARSNQSGKCPEPQIEVGVSDADAGEGRDDSTGGGWHHVSD